MGPGRSIAPLGRTTLAGVSDSQNPDDLRLHLDQIVGANALRAEPAENETEAEARTRLSTLLSSPLNARVSAALAELSEAVPGIGAAETTKLLATRSARDALREGREALARVDSHLASATSKRNPLVGRNYGVYGKNPETFGGVLRALAQANRENERINALPETDADRAFAFTPVVAHAVSEAHAHLTAQLSERFRTRGELSPDEQFFAAGACHVLAAVLLEAYPRSGLCALLLQPSPGFRGGHVIVADESTAIDCRGCHQRDEYLVFLERERRSSMPGWQHSLIPVEDPSSWEFCRRYGYRHPSQFPFDVIDRAERFREQLDLAGWVPDALV